MVCRPCINPASPEALSPKPFELSGGRLEVLSLKPRWKLAGSGSAVLDGGKTEKIIACRLKWSMKLLMACQLHAFMLTTGLQGPGS